MVYAAIDIHKAVFQAATLDVETGELAEQRFAATPDALSVWVEQQPAGLAAVAIEATTGWRWVARELERRGVVVLLADPGEASARQGKRRRPKTDRLDARWLVTLLAKQMLPTVWMAPADIQRLRDQTRFRKKLVEDHTRWAQRLHSLLTHEGWACSRGRLLTAEGLRWVDGLRLDPLVRTQIEAMLTIMRVVHEQLDQLDAELRRYAKSDRRIRALCRLFGIGPIIACHLVAEIGDATRFRRARQVVRLSGLDPVVRDSADTKRRGRLAKAGSPQLRWALVEAAQHAHRASSPDHAYWLAVAARIGKRRATLSVARKLAHRAYHVLADLERDAA
jgi:transposase